jgi:DNA polymerase/3'-5' exonuclease PolX
MDRFDGYPGLGPKTLALLHQKFHIQNFEDLRRVLDTGGPLKLRGLGDKKIESLQHGRSNIVGRAET